MVKSKIYATGNETIKGEFNISYYILEKDENFLDWLGKLLTEVFGIENGENLAKIVVKDITDENGDFVEQKIYIKNVKKMDDVHEKYFSKRELNASQDRLDIFYGKNRIYVTLRASRDGRKKFGHFVSKTKDWIKVVKVEKIPIYIKEKSKKKP